MMSHKRHSSTELYARPKSARRISAPSIAFASPFFLRTESPVPVSTQPADHTRFLPAKLVLEMDTRIKFRIGAPALLLEPVHTVHRVHFTEWNNLDFRAQLRNILHEEGVTVTAFNAVRRVQKGGKEEEVRKTVLVESDMTIPNEYERWTKATTRMNNY
ncbi:hypothetical protein NX059_000957 [Plenodomus lindquistii]|nr:hypothetical protein NX059_000957 [Plenodomus lindquistii]